MGIPHTYQSDMPGFALSETEFFVQQLHHGLEFEETVVHMVSLRMPPPAVLPEVE